MKRHLRWAVSCYKEVLVWLFLAFGKEAVKLLVLSGYVKGVIVPKILVVYFIHSFMTSFA